MLMAIIISERVKINGWQVNSTKIKSYENIRKLLLVQRPRMLYQAMHTAIVTIIMSDILTMSRKD